MSILERIYKILIENNRYLLILQGIKTTMIIVAFSCLFGVIIAAIVCYMRLSKNKIISGIARLYISFFRGIPIVLLLTLVYYVVFAGVNISSEIVSIVVFSLYHSAYVAEIFRSGLSSINPGQIIAAKALGFKKTQIFPYILFPQVVRVIFPVYKGELMTLVKLTSVVGYIGVCDLTRSVDIIRSQTFDAFWPLVIAIILYFIIIKILTIILSKVEKMIYQGRKEI